MIKFGSNNKAENIGILEKEEARAYIDFLEAERCRHKLDIEGAEWEASYHFNSAKYAEANKLLWQSAIKRHEEDIKAIDVLVETLKHRYGI